MQLNAQVMARWLKEFASDIAANEALLTDLDRQIGDADHGANMVRGTKAVAELDPADFADAKAYVKKVAMTLISTVGGASGPLYGTFFLRLAAALPADGPIGHAVWLESLRAGVQGVMDRGKAQAGDKTMLDALLPAADAFESHPDRPWQAAAEAAAAGRDATVPMEARKGRASYLGQRSIGVADPGASSSTLLLEAAARTLA
ncbi:dihydroxyacetone kinase subunit DhaL [Propionimicrobium sp. PCR01-08-3]|uniref:dihydroxyacetone kinase subunit DhaL n=1 Tax=Propionimicrobium sp. PCR01-08-3 TaxID=3052086 RepID=UPI00255C4E0C|nr:dihydroxyacetone kinase subunit DhaL [Propionimicrobium sp. PCR01-08-3]WIY81514.1 dihydroxyacetone kinase subunit DhaL [Propionimicrobium sp. PCR01-08-3]